MSREVSQYAMEAAYKEVERDALTRSASQDSPRAIILGGQPGSGKAALAAQAVHEFHQNGSSVVIDADRMREENPRYKQLSRDDPQHAADRTHKEAGEWATRLTMAAIENRRNLVVDGTMRNPENIRDLLTRLQSNGYAIEARVLAVNPETSMVRSRLRFEEQVVERGIGRFVNQEQHDIAYHGMIESVRVLERDNLLNAIQVYDAHQRMVYSNRIERGEWQRPPEAVLAIEQERNREWTHAEHGGYVSALQEITKLARERESHIDQGTITVGSGVTHESSEFINLHGTVRTGNESGTRSTIADSALMAAKLENARRNQSTFEQTATYRRAQAFDNLPKIEALERFPDLDGAYKRLQEVKQGWTDVTTQTERESSYLTTKADFADALHRGHIPVGNVSVEESRRVMEMAAAYRGLMLRDAVDLKQDYRGEVVATSTHHVLVKVSDMVAVRYDKAALDRSVRLEEKVAIQHAAQGKSQVYETGREPSREKARDVGLVIVR